MHQPEKAATETSAHAPQFAMGEAELLPSEIPRRGSANDMEVLVSQLMAENRCLRKMLTSGPDALVTIDAYGIIQFGSDSVEDVLGWKLDDLIGQNINVLLSEPDRSEHDGHLERYRTTKKSTVLGKSREFSVVRRDGTTIQCSVTLWQVNVPDDVSTRFMGIIRDVTKERLVDTELKRFRTALDTSADAVFLIDRNEMSFIDLNDTACQTLAYTRDELLQMGPHDIMPFVAKEELEAEFDGLLQSQDKRGVIETIHRRKDGSAYPVEVLLRALTKEDSMTIIASVRDITERQRLTKQLRDRAYNDQLTGLPNRTSILNSIQNAIDRKAGLFAILFLDLDGFKHINDSLGHECGDDLLRQIAQRLQHGLRRTDRISPARLGGDEFVVLIEGLSEPSQAIAIAERFLKLTSESYQLEGHTVYCTASIGVVTNERPHTSAAEMLREADLAMYNAKTAGKARYAMFDESLRKKAEKRLRIEHDLRDAMARREFTLAYQPIVSLSTGRVHGVEALLRWQHPEHGLLMPAEFIPIAEESNMVLSLGEWVLDEACRQMVLWQRSLGEHAPSTVHVNLSRRQLMQPELSKIVKRTLDRHRLSPTCLHLEVTENGIIANQERAVATLNELRKLGTRIDMDDFGTGYWSLACLHEFPFDVLKIDRNFIANTVEGREFVTLLHAIITLAVHLDLRVVAEGIEQPEQVCLLKTLGCEFGQGNFFSGPLQPDTFGAFASSNMCFDVIGNGNTTSPEIDLSGLVQVCEVETGV